MARQEAPCARRVLIAAGFVVLDGDDPHLVVDDRTVLGFEFKPKWYSRRKVSIDPTLVDELKKRRLASGGTALVFSARGGGIDPHILQHCKRVAKREGFDPKDWHPHKFRASQN
ncbi:MAG: hypothetical protein WAK48_21735 [Candidatus Acidiferrum sp.]|jgi:hypothetical protein